MCDSHNGDKKPIPILYESAIGGESTKSRTRQSREATAGLYSGKPYFVKTKGQPAGKSDATADPSETIRWARNKTRRRVSYSLAQIFLSVMI
ncbi:MAG: hypothetical protein A3H69_04120 [Candidatus Sungbacteria bacterium RIFCSPLOWO2_02_FULL_47_9]|nr:MAG: hypothetical protein A3A28_05175 [Candidatus Sungbacteria bacterium RIFCSPLOWO2_01_FULL_47_32]OHA10064.1 MAG: hypothetical protein A3H69_04120 [Candidatus Sungbacteria bacterium RIFCSPLOWO2_02_FULL_47_9]